MRRNSEEIDGIGHRFDDTAVYKDSFFFSNF
jgi:hypothetical protein